MNAFAPVTGFTVGQIDLRDPETCRRVDAYVDAAEGATPFHRTAWIRAVERGCGQQGVYLVAEEGEGIRGVLPSTAVRSLLFGSALVSTGFGVGGGILADSPEVAEALAETCWSLVPKLRCTGAELRGGVVPDGWHEKGGTYAGFVRDLPSDDEAILKAIPRKQRAEVRRAQTFGLEVEIGSGESDQAAHYAVYAESLRNLGTPVFPQRLFREMLAAWGEDANILTVRKDGRPVASVLSLYYRGTVYPYWGGGTEEARGLRANEHMYHELMRYAAARGCTRFDFGRSKVGTGPYAYKKNWGFEPQPLVYAARALDGAAPREINPLSPKYRLQVALWKRLPLALANRLGPLLARGLG
jgi:FemAB-related protein (PEP-CTERM system-associated)